MSKHDVWVHILWTVFALCGVAITAAIVFAIIHDELDRC